ncbi:putative nucleic acid-binding protein [Granulicella aggregans]|uniref:Putative nucleic acid-binding protein n=1 Tax=Granulicella aggregans TaxID=474949 RepID=A0A7W7ZI43_9BACT|nr:PIN domain-containing protein [Granulicella aggregans]MBB5060231.1 putative nucleic acid-binding protein [Granulicella aggregans]
MSKPRIYCDANPIIELAKLAKKTHTPSRERELWFLSQMLKAAQNDEIELYTSSISIAECVPAGDDWSKDVQEFFVGVLTSGLMFRLVQDSIFVAEQARDLRWTHNLQLKGADAIHVASAIEAECTELISWDGDLNNERSIKKAAILTSLGLQVILPSQSKLLPIYYQSEPTPILAGLELPPIN